MHGSTIAHTMLGCWKQDTISFYLQTFNAMKKYFGVKRLMEAITERVIQLDNDGENVHDLCINIYDDKVYICDHSGIELGQVDTYTQL
jgi:hypothetical protein